MKRYFKYEFSPANDFYDCPSFGKLTWWFIIPLREVDVVDLKSDFSNIGF
jgi:hypothetical protein